MALVNSVISWLIKKRIHQMQLFMKYPHDTQAEWFKTLISSASRTEWGMKYDYKSIDSVSAFQERVPVSTYEDLLPYIERLRKGEQNIYSRNTNEESTY